LGFVTIYFAQCKTAKVHVMFDNSLK